MYFCICFNVARLCIDAFDDVPHPDDVGSTVINTDVREGGKLGWYPSIT